MKVHTINGMVKYTVFSDEVNRSKRLYELITIIDDQNREIEIKKIKVPIQIERLLLSKKENGTFIFTSGPLDGKDMQAIKVGSEQAVSNFVQEWNHIKNITRFIILTIVSIPLVPIFLSGVMLFLNSLYALFSLPRVQKEITKEAKENKIEIRESHKF